MMGSGARNGLNLLDSQLNDRFSGEVPCRTAMLFQRVEVLIVSFPGHRHELFDRLGRIVVLASQGRLRLEAILGAHHKPRLWRAHHLQDGEPQRAWRVGSQ